MKIKEISAGVKLTKNYDSYQASLTAEIELNENSEEVGEILMEKSLAIVNKKIFEKNTNLSDKNKEIEVGAAWISKNSRDKLSVQYSKHSKFEDIDIKNLEKIEQGFEQKIGENIFVFKKISENKRKNRKMPNYRIYKIGEKDE
jgi:hypothetical protein